MQVSTKKKLKMLLVQLTAKYSIRTDLYPIYQKQHVQQNKVPTQTLMILVQRNLNVKLKKCVKTFWKKLKHTTKLSQRKKRIGKRIGVQLTATGRKRNGVSRGIRKCQQGPVSSEQQWLGLDNNEINNSSVFRKRKQPKVPKRKHLLAGNITQNQQMLESGKYNWMQTQRSPNPIILFPSPMDLWTQLNSGGN